MKYFSRLFRCAYEILPNHILLIVLYGGLGSVSSVVPLMSGSLHLS